MVFLIRADASFEIGTGHVMRCIALGQMLIDEGHQVIFLTQTDNQMINERILKEGFGLNTFYENDILKDANYTVNAGKDIKADWVVTDGYKFKTEYQKIIKNAGFKLMCIDDICECHYVSDFVLNQNINAEIIYNYSCEDYTRLLLGSNYLLFRREFWDFRNYKRVFNDNPKNILISIGGTSLASSLIPNILKILNSNIKKYRIKIVLPNTTDIVDKLTDMDNVEIVIGVEEMVDFYKWADIGINCFGLTSMEMIWMKLPFVSIGLNQNHKLFEESFKNIGIRVLTKDNITKEMENVLNNYSEYANNFEENNFGVLAIKNIFQNG